MKLALGSGVGHAARYAANNASNLSSSLPRIGSIMVTLYYKLELPGSFFSFASKDFKTLCLARNNRTLRAFSLTL
jgi:hypothetical protein